MSSIVLVRYLRFEEDLLRKQHDEDTSEEEDSAPADSSVLKLDAFARSRHSAYKVSVVIVLGGILDFSKEQFANNLEWIVPLLSRLIVCETLEVRLCVREIYRLFVNPLILK